MALLFDDEIESTFTTINVPKKDSHILRITHFSQWSDDLQPFKSCSNFGFQFQDSNASPLSDFDGKTDAEICEYCRSTLADCMDRDLPDFGKSFVIRIPKKLRIIMNCYIALTTS